MKYEVEFNRNEEFRDTPDGKVLIQINPEYTVSGPVCDIRPGDTCDIGRFSSQYSGPVICVEGDCIPGNPSDLAVYVFIPKSITG